MIKVRDENFCEFCQNEVQTIQHLFYECDKFVKIWLELQQWLVPYLNFNQYLTKITILFGIKGTSNRNSLINLLLLITKRFIFICKCKSEEPKLCNLKSTIKTYYDIELQIARTNVSQRDKINLKWEPLRTLWI